MAGSLWRPRPAGQPDKTKSITVHNTNDLEALLQSGYRYALSLSHDPARADDLLQDAWVAILGANGPMTKPYMFKAIRSRFINHHRNSRVTLVSLDGGAEDTPDHYSEFNEPLSAAELARLDDALATLRDVEREVLYLTLVEGYTAQEVTDLTGHSRGTVLSLTHRARAKLRRYFADPLREVNP